ncbi:MAG: hypothetical protein PVG27_14080 [Chloroflexota bacterium]
MKRIIAVVLTVAFAISAMAVPAMAGDGVKRNAWGQVIKVQCTAAYGEPMPYGKLWRTLKREMRQNPEGVAAKAHMGVKPSAKRFATRKVATAEGMQTLLDIHCPIAAPTAPRGKVARTNKGWGMLIRTQCTAAYGERMPYGKLWRTLKREMRQNPDGAVAKAHMGVKPSAKRFAVREVSTAEGMQTLLDIHCPVPPVPAT